MYFSKLYYLLILYFFLAVRNLKNKTVTHQNQFTTVLLYKQ